MSSAPANSLPGPHVVGLFKTRQEAEDALDELLAHDYPSDTVSVVSAEGKPVKGSAVYDKQ